MSRRPFGVSLLGWLTVLQSLPSALILLLATGGAGLLVALGGVELLPVLGLWWVLGALFGFMPWLILFRVRARWVLFVMPLWWGFLAGMSVLSSAPPLWSASCVLLFFLGSAYLLISDDAALWFREQPRLRRRA